MRLWAHQAEAARAACLELSGGSRATVVAACGTGKTVTGAEVSRRVAPGGRVLAVVPTLELLAQTGRSWAAWLGGGAAAGWLGWVAARPGHHRSRCPGGGAGRGRAGDGAVHLCQPAGDRGGAP